MKAFLIISAIYISTIAFGQKKIYDPSANAKQDIAKLVEHASKENKKIILQVGGNWCSWCLALDKFIKKEDEITSYINENYLYYHLNYSQENKNQDLLDKYKNPEKNGFPVLVILDPSGNYIGVQETGSLEMGKSYDKDKVLTMLKNWSTVIKSN